MFCKLCNKDTALVNGEPSIKGGRYEPETEMVKMTVSLVDGCEECGSVQRECVILAERSMSGIHTMQPHLKHAMTVEVTDARRVMETPGYGSVLVSFNLNCSCGKLDSYQSKLTGSAKEELST